MLLDVALHQFPEDFLTFALHRCYERLDSGNEGYRNRPGCDCGERLTLLERVEDRLQALLSEEQEQRDAAATDDLQQC
jgi:hypothetical protein